MRIAHVTATFPPYYAGTGIVCYHNALGLARLGHEVTVFTAQHPNGEYADSEEFTVCRLPALFRMGNAPFLPGLLGLEDFDIIHLHHPFIFGSEMIWAVSKIRGIPYVLTHHNDLIGDGLRRYLFRTYSAAFTRRVFIGASKIAVVSLDHASSCTLTPIFQQLEDDVVEIPNGVDTDRFAPGLNGSTVRRQYGIRDGATALLFVGALDRAHHYRRVDLLLEAVERVKDPRLHLLVAGDGDLLAKFQEIAGNLEVGSRIHFLGKVAHEDLPTVYSAADVFVLPSHIQEAFPLVLLEAMACGKPVIASNLPGVRSMVDHGKDGLLVRQADVNELAEKIQVLMNDPERRQEMGAQGRAKVESRFAWARIVSKLVHVYQGVLDTNNGGSQLWRDSFH